MRTYAIGDIHGHIELFARSPRVDRRRSSQTWAQRRLCMSAIWWIAARIAAVWSNICAQASRPGKDWVVLKGNHDRMFTNYIRDINYHDPCLRTDLSYLHPKIGGAATLASYGVKNAADRPLAPVHAEAVAAVPADHICDFLNARPELLPARRGDLCPCRHPPRHDH